MHPDLQEPTPAGAPPSPKPFTALGLSRTLIALLSSCLFVHLSKPGGCKVWLGLARGFLLGGLPSLEPAGPKERFGGLGFLIHRRPDGLFASDLPGLPRSPQLLARPGAPSPAGGLLAPEARLPSSTAPGLTQCWV